MTLFRCTRCLYPNSKPDLWFNEAGLCSACMAFDKRREIDWQAREAEFADLVRRHPGKSHDVIVACSGGKDSTWQVLKCLELGLRPLAVTATTDHLSALGRRNLDNISNLCDHIEVTAHKETRKKISAFALREVGDISWCEHHLIWSVPAREAVQRGIPIVLYGECPQNEYGAGPAGSENAARLTKEWADEFGGLLGLRLSDLSEILHIEDRHLELYRYPDGDVRAVFMGAYFEWDGEANAEAAQNEGFEFYPWNVEGSVGGYENLDNLQTGVHDQLRWLKFGYSRADDILSSRIRRGRISRDGAAEHSMLIGKRPETYLGIPIKDILARINITMPEFEAICDRFTNKPVVEWASSSASFQHFYGTSMDASKESSSIRAVA